MLGWTRTLGSRPHGPALPRREDDSARSALCRIQVCTACLCSGMAGPTLLCSATSKTEATGEQVGAKSGFFVFLEKHQV
jgi:hypothetical protein